MHKVVLICTDCTKTFSLETEMLTGLILAINEKGSETIHTERNSYEVKGILIGDMSNQIIFT